MTTSVWKFLWKYLSKLRILFYSVLFSVLAGEFFVRLSLYYASKIVDILAAEGPRRGLMLSALGFAGLASLFLFAKGLLLNVLIFIEARFLPVYMSRISKDLFNYAHRHSTAFFAEEMAGNISGKSKPLLMTVTAFITTFSGGSFRRRLPLLSVLPLFSTLTFLCL